MFRNFETPLFDFTLVTKKNSHINAGVYNLLNLIILKNTSSFLILVFFHHPNIHQKSYNDR